MDFVPSASMDLWRRALSHRYPSPHSLPAAASHVPPHAPLSSTGSAANSVGGSPALAASHPPNSEVYAMALSLTSRPEDVEQPFLDLISSLEIRMDSPRSDAELAAAPWGSPSIGSPSQRSSRPPSVNSISAISHSSCSSCVATCVVSARSTYILTAGTFSTGTRIYRVRTSGGCAGCNRWSDSGCTTKTPPRLMAAEAAEAEEAVEEAEEQTHRPRRRRCSASSARAAESARRRATPRSTRCTRRRLALILAAAPPWLSSVSTCRGAP